MSEKRMNAMSGLDDRCQDQDGEIRRKRSDTLVGTLRETYGPGFAPGVRSDAKLGTLLDRAGGSSLTDNCENAEEVRLVRRLCTSARLRLIVLCPGALWLVGHPSVGI